MLYDSLRLHCTAGDIITLGKVRTLILSNGNLDKVFKKYPQSFEVTVMDLCTDMMNCVPNMMDYALKMMNIVTKQAVKRNSMTIQTGHRDDLILMTHKHTKQVMGQMRQAGMGDPRAMAGGGGAGGGAGGGGGMMAMMGGGGMMMGGGGGMGGGAMGGGGGQQSGQQSMQSQLAPSGGGSMGGGGGGGAMGGGGGMGQQGGMTTANGQPMRGMQTQQDAQMAVKELREKLQWMPMLRDAPADFLDRFVSMMTCKYVGAMTTLLREGDRGKEMVVIVQGNAGESQCPQCRSTTLTQLTACCSGVVFRF